MPAKSPLHHASLEYSRQKAGVAQVPLGACPGLPGDLRHFKGSKQSAEGRKQKAEGGHQMVFILIPDT
ncbi:MAG: hypothetical protein WB763_18405 [Terriglobia bacterium]